MRNYILISSSRSQDRGIETHRLGKNFLSCKWLSRARSNMGAITNTKPPPVISCSALMYSSSNSTHIRGRARAFVHYDDNVLCCVSCAGEQAIVWVVAGWVKQWQTGAGFMALRAGSGGTCSGCYLRSLRTRQCNERKTNSLRLYIGTSKQARSKESVCMISSRDARLLDRDKSGHLYNQQATQKIRVQWLDCS